MNDIESKHKPDWPREVSISQTIDAIAAELGDDYDEDDDSGLVTTAIMESTHTVEINSWEEIPKGYELVSQDDKEAHEAYLECKRRE